MPFYMVILHFTSLLADFFYIIILFSCAFFDTLILLR
jgi:hypothetical protein